MLRDSREEDSHEGNFEGEEESEVELQDKNPGFSGTLNVSSIITFWKEVNVPNRKVQISGKWVSCIFLSTFYSKGMSYVIIC